MGDTSPAKIWAILAPLAALAGLAFLHFRRKNGEESGSVKKAVSLAESNIEEESVTESDEERLSIADCDVIEPDEEPDSGFRTGDNFPEPRLSVDKTEEIVNKEELKEIVSEIQASPQITKVTINKTEKSDTKPEIEPEIEPEIKSEILMEKEEPKVIEQVPEIQEKPEVEEKVIEKEPEVKVTSSPQPEVNMPAEQELPTVDQQSIPEVVQSIQGETKEPEIEVEPEVKVTQSPLPEVIDIKQAEPEVPELQPDVIEKPEVIEEPSSEMEVVEVQSSPAVLESIRPKGSHVEEQTESMESLESALEKLGNQSFEIVTDENIEIEPLTTIEEHTEPNTIQTGSSGGSLSRVRTESEILQEHCQDWANSPITKFKNTPVENASRPVKDGVPTPVSSIPEDAKKSTARQRPSEIKSKPRKSFRGRMNETEEDDRESTTTSPDSAKDGNLVSSSTSGGSKRKKGRSRRPADKRKNGEKGKRSHKNSNESSKGKTDSTGVQDTENTSSDSGTHTDDNTETYVEISGFPTQLIGALIGKNGSNIKKLQTDSKCKIVVKNYPVESGEQYISIEGTGKNVRKAVSILKKKFPDLNLADVSSPVQTEYPEIPQTYEEQAYNYNEYWPGSVNNNILQVDLAEGVPVEVRVTAYSPDFPNLWLQPYTHPSHEKFARLEANMSDFYTMDKTESILTNYLMIGDFAVCLHHAPDEITGQELPKWYRVQIIQYPDDNHATVLYVDFGGYATVPIEMVRKLIPRFHPTFAQCRFQAICVTLDDVIPMENVGSEYITEAGVYLHDIISKAPPNSIEATVNAEAILQNPTMDPNVPKVTLRYRNEVGEMISINEVLSQKCSILESKFKCTL